MSYWRLKGKKCPFLAFFYPLNVNNSWSRKVEKLMQYTFLPSSTSSIRWYSSFLILKTPQNRQFFRPYIFAFNPKKSLITKKLRGYRLDNKQILNQHPQIDQIELQKFIHRHFDIYIYFFFFFFFFETISIHWPWPKQGIYQLTFWNIKMR